MSLINQMLRDLEERRADELTRQNLQREIRPLPPVGGGGIGRPVALAAGVLLLACGGVWLAYEEGIPQRLAGSAPQPTPPVPVTVPPVTPATPPVVALPVDAMLPREVEAPAGADGLRLTLALQSLPSDLPPAAGQPPAVEQPPVPSSTPTPSAAAGDMVRPLPIPANPPRAVPKAAETSPTPSSIEKSASLASPRERAEVEYRKAQLAASGGRTGEALDALHAALRQDPGHAPARQSLIRALVEGRRGDEAEVLLREGLELQPAQIGWAMTLARLQVERNDLPAARRTLGASAAYGARSADYQGFFGHIEYRLGHGREAAGLYQTATQLAPGEGRWWLGLGLALDADGHAGEAREAFRRALASGNLNADLAAIAEQKAR